jgi:hypothetical protein
LYIIVQQAFSGVERGGAAWLARLAHNQQVASSNLAPATILSVAQVDARPLWVLSESQEGPYIEGIESFRTNHFRRPVISSAAASGAQLGLLLALCATSLLTLLGDGYTTMIGLQHGFVEGNPLAKWLFKKIGQSFTLFLEGTVLLFAIGAISNYDLNAAYVFAGILTAGEAAMCVRNYKLLKKSNISLK